MQKQQCFHCAHWVQLVHVHGHYQCPVCGINLLPCCDGDNCDTNQLLRTANAGSNNPEKGRKEEFPDHFQS